MFKTYLGIATVNFLAAACTGGLTHLVCGCSFVVLALVEPKRDAE